MITPTVLFDWFQTNSLDIVTSNPFGKSGNATFKWLNHSNSPAGWSWSGAWKDIKTGLFTFRFQEREWRTAITRRRALLRASRSAACAWERYCGYSNIQSVWSIRFCSLGKDSILVNGHGQWRNPQNYSEASSSILETYEGEAGHFTHVLSFMIDFFF